MTGPLRRAALLAATALLAAPAAAAAATIEMPMSLPGDATAASVRAADSTWIVGARPSAASRALAHRYGARRIGPVGTGGYVVARGRARAFAGALRRSGLLVYAQPDTLAEPLQAVPDDPLSTPPHAWRAAVVSPALVPPPVTDTSPLIALVDAELDATHPEFAGGRTTTLPQFGVTDSHGTATASVAAAPVNGVGIVGVWPGARALNVPLPDTITCASSTAGITKAIEQGAAVINMSYGSTSICFPDYVALQFAVALGIVPVAAAGNEFTDGNPLEFPASLPHVLTIAAVNPDLTSAVFSNTSGAIDLAAPGVSIMTAVPPALDTDGTQDGYQVQSGTSFSAPMVAAAVAWIRAKRPTLTADQVAQAVRLSARDLAPAGWDVDTGFGMLSVGRAETITPPPPDPGEPNDDIEWVDGRMFGTSSPLVYEGRRRARLRGQLDVFEDPADVYRVRLRPRSRAAVSANPAARGDIALYGFAGRAKRLNSRPLVRSAHRGRRTERIVLRNRSRRSRTFYVALGIQNGSRILDATYALRVG